MFEPDDDSSASNQPPSGIPRIPLTTGDSFQIADDMRPADLALIDRMAVVSSVAIGDEEALKVSE